MSILALFLAMSFGSDGQDDTARLLEWCRSHRSELVADLTALVQVPSVSQQPE